MDASEIIAFLVPLIMDDLKHNAETDNNVDSPQNNNSTGPDMTSNIPTEEPSCPTRNSSTMSNNNFSQHWPTHVYPMWVPHLQYYLIPPSAPYNYNVESNPTTEPSLSENPPVQNFPQHQYPYFHQPAPVYMNQAPVTPHVQNNQPSTSKDNSTNDKSSIVIQVPTNVTSFVDSTGRSWICMDLVNTKDPSSAARKSKKSKVESEKTEKCIVLRLGGATEKLKKLIPVEKFKRACACEGVHKFPVRHEESSQHKSNEKPTNTLKWADEEEEKKPKSSLSQDHRGATQDKNTLNRLKSELIRSISYVDRSEEDVDENQPDSNQSMHRFYERKQSSSAGISLRSATPRENIANRPRRCSPHYRTTETDDSLTSFDWPDDTDECPSTSRWSSACNEEWQDGPNKMSRSVKKIQSDGFVKTRRRCPSPASGHESRENRSVENNLHRHDVTRTGRNHSNRSEDRFSRRCDDHSLMCECQSSHWRSDSTHTHHSTDNSPPASISTQTNSAVFRPLVTPTQPSVYTLGGYSSNVDRPLEENVHRNHLLRHVPIGSLTINQPQQLFRFNGSTDLSSTTDANADTLMLRARRLRLFANAGNNLSFQRITPPIMEHDRPRAFRNRRWLGRTRIPRHIPVVETNQDIENLQHRRQRSANTVRPSACPRRNPKLAEEFNRIQNLDGESAQAQSSGKEESNMTAQEREEREDNDRQDQEDKREYEDEF